MNDMLNTREKVKAWCEEEYANCVKYGMNPASAMTRAYGALMCALNKILPEWDDELATWWNDEMHPKFEELKRG